MRVIFTDFGRRKLQTTHDRDFKGGACYHMVVPVCILSTILESIEMDLCSPASSSCAMNFPLSPHSWQRVVFGFWRIIS